MNIYPEKIIKTKAAIVRYLCLSIVFAVPLLWHPSAYADDATLYYGTGVDANLVDVLPRAVKGDLVWEDTHFVAIGYFKSLSTPELLQSAFDSLGVQNTRTGFESLVVKHSGMQNNYELDLSYTLRFNNINLPGGLFIRIGVGVGLSYAFGRPSYEDGSKENPEKRYRLQNYNSYEFEFGLERIKGFTLISRIHHRSGIYGIIAPRHVGSNFITTGLRYSFD